MKVRHSIVQQCTQQQPSDDRRDNYVNKPFSETRSMNRCTMDRKPIINDCINSTKVVIIIKKTRFVFSILGGIANIRQKI